VVAVVVPRSEARAELGEAIRDWACQRTAPYKVPRRFVFRSDLPRNALGKVNKKELLGTLSSL
jgi:malonyl-CoA/methylmalonyl-CoA synthetase